MIFYKYPNFYKDGQPIGAFSQAFAAYPDLAAELEQAHAIAWGNNGIEDSEKFAEAQATIAQLQLETAPDIAAIALELQAAGLTAWADRAITAADPDNGVLNLVLALYGVAKEPRSLTQCDRVRELFMQIGGLSDVWPTPEESTAMQAILTANNVGEKWLKFA